MKRSNRQPNVIYQIVYYNPEDERYGCYISLKSKSEVLHAIDDCKRRRCERIRIHAYKKFDTKRVS